MLVGSPETEAKARAAVARARVARAITAADRRPFSLVVGLLAVPVDGRWMRGALALALLCGAVVSLALDMDLFSTSYKSMLATGRQYETKMLSGEPPQASSDPLTIFRPVVASSGFAVRFQGTVTESLYWSLRSAGITPKVAAEYLQLLSTRTDVSSDIAPYDRFDLVISKEEAQPLLYAALHRIDGPDIELMKWTTAGKTDWFDIRMNAVERSEGLRSPVTGSITSGFGVRYHPILRLARMHAGIDFGAAWGSPILAAAEGVVVGSGWSDGYGRQVQIAHSGGIVTSYSHMSKIAASLGQTVHQGEVIGYVGSSGQSTGSHLHFEVRINGRAVDPMHVQMQRRPIISLAERKAFEARLKLLMAIGQQA